jgi:hypothetical protein
VERRIPSKRTVSDALYNAAAAVGRARQEASLVKGCESIEQDLSTTWEWLIDAASELGPTRPLRTRGYSDLAA